jgi:hypothetical protein
MRRIVLPASMLLVAAALAFAPAPDAAATEELCGTREATPQALYDKLAKEAKLREMRRSDVYVALEDGSNGTLWTFTLPAHPAHPAAVCRRIVERRGVLEVPTSIVCNGAEAACAKLRSDFEMLNENMIQQLQKKSQ